MPPAEQPEQPPEKGLCRKCGKPSSGFRCDRCGRRKAEKARASYRRRVQSGQCVCCKHQATVGAFCLAHWFRNIGQTYGLGKKNGGIAMLQRFWERQGGRCAVTGEQLIPGVNASLDHILPVSRGGTSAASNLRWVTATVNHMKWDMTDAEFISKCKVIVQRATRTTEVHKLDQVDRSN